MRVVYIIIRYSLLYNKPPNSFYLSSKKSIQQYKDALFDKERLTIREEMFSRFTLKSLACMAQRKPSDIVFKVIVLASSELPDENKMFLISKEKRFSWLNIFFLSPEEIKIDEILREQLLIDSEANKLGSSDEIVVGTARLDDDDVLNKNYLSYVEKYLKSDCDDFFVSFPRGVYLYYDVKKKAQLGSVLCNVKNIALGLIHIKKYKVSHIKEPSQGIKHIYNSGNHKKVDIKNRCIYDQTFPSYVRLNTELSDRMFTIDDLDERKRRLLIEIKKKSNIILSSPVNQDDYFDLDLELECLSL